MGPWKLTFFIVAVASTVSCMADELYRITANFNGNKKPDVILVSTSPSKVQWRSKVTIAIGKSEFSTDFFSGENDLPEIRIVAIDRKRADRQLIVETPEAGSCIFNVLSVIDRKIVPIIHFESGPDCRPPQPLGNGEMSISRWQGFWWKEDRYKLDETGTKLELTKQAIYLVDVSGVAAKQINLEGAECAAKLIQPGTFIKIKKFDSNTDKYRLETQDGNCGWLPSRDLSPPDGVIKELPWAG